MWKFLIKPDFKYWMSLYWTSFIKKDRYMFNKRKRIDKKWRKNINYYICTEVTNQAMFMVKNVSV